MDAPLGIEPRLIGSKPTVLPLDDGAILEEDVGFEPTEPFGSTVFKTVGLSHSPNLPYS